MRFCQAAALALVGWYLMMPPLEGNTGSLKLELAAPFPQWDIQASFDSAHDCEIAKVKSVQWAKDQATNGKFEDENARHAFAWQHYDEECVATDDPRLKGN